VAVTVRLFAAARAAAGESELVVEGGTLQDVLTQITAAKSALVSVLPQCSYLVNEVSCKNLDAAVLNGDVVDVLPPFAGG